MAGRNRTSVQVRFQEKYVVNAETGCWEWTGAINNNGYGLLNVDSRSRLAHRISYEIHVGQIPESRDYHGTCVLHKCDVRRCVNPDHLFLGTVQDNTSDMDAKGRRVNAPQIGEKHGNSILTDDAARAIKEILRRHPPSCNHHSGSAGIQAFLGRWFGVSHITISAIHTGRLWRHVL